MLESVNWLHKKDHAKVSQWIRDNEFKLRVIESFPASWPAWKREYAMSVMKPINDPINRQGGFQ